jgi:uncharacterized protein (TIGR00290 family)
VVELLTTLNERRDRVTMHVVRRSLIDRQAAAVGLPVTYVAVPEDAGNEAYERRMGEALAAAAERGIERVAFADLHLEDVRAYREQNLEASPLEGTWPLWGRDTAEQARRFLEAGFRATVVCVDGSVLDESFAGRQFDRDFLATLPDGVDPCGENGEFHTFVTDGPPFSRPIPVERGERHSRELEGTTVRYCDLLPGGDSSGART